LRSSTTSSTLEARSELEQARDSCSSAADTDDEEDDDWRGYDGEWAVYLKSSGGVTMKIRAS
jgi:hypothetical protein